MKPSDFQKSSDTSAASFKKKTAAALGHEKCDVVIKGTHFLNVFSGTWEKGDIGIVDGWIVGTCESYEGKEEIDGSSLHVAPGFMDAHVHIESSLCSPTQFENIVLPHGTTTVLWDPHEIANVWGKKGVEWALKESEKLLLDVFVMLPSCVPASHLETSGATLTSEDLLIFAGHPKAVGLAEMMNFPGVIYNDPEVVQKLTDFKNVFRDGHAPLLSGKELNAYLCGGIHACHESTTRTEAEEKLRKGMHVLIREGSCAKDAHELLPLLNAYTSSVLSFCSDDRNPADIQKEGHLDFIIRKALEMGKKPEDVFRSASFTPARTYGFFDRGVVAPGYLADLVLFEKGNKDNFANFKLVDVFKKGKRSSQYLKNKNANVVNKTQKNIHLADGQVSTDKLQIQNSHIKDGKAMCQVIEVIEGQIVTPALSIEMSIEQGNLKAEPSRDLLKVAVFERHHRTGNVGVAMVKGFALKKGAIASSIGHDSHNITVVGVSDDLILKAVSHIQKIDGGIVVVNEKGEVLADLALPIGGLMSDQPWQNIAEGVFALKKAVKSLGCPLEEPFLQLSFLALPVIPFLKVTDKGLVDVSLFQVVSTFKS